MNEGSVATIETNISLAEWAQSLYIPSRYKVAHGGRGGAKTFSFAAVLVMRGSKKKLKVMCCREFQNSMDESVKPALEEAIIFCGLEAQYEIQKKKIIGRNGTTFEFKGMARNIYSIKGWQGYDIVWVEEANTLQAASLELLRPTIRKTGSEIWFSMNRHQRTDAVDEMFLSENGPPAGAIIMEVNHYDNPFMNKELEDERLLCLEQQPERYAHVWEGQPDDNSHEKVILPFHWLLKAVDAHKRLGIKPTGWKHGGLDIADTGDDENCLALRHGPLLKSVEVWQKPYLYMTTLKAHTRALMFGISRLFYDATGIGAGVRSDLSRIAGRPYKAKPFIFGGAVEGKERLYSYERKNEDMFARKNIQAGWNLRLRLQNTMYLLEGRKDVTPEECLFIDGKIKNLNKLLKELSQPLYDYDASGKMVVVKQPKVLGVPKKESPNRYDACIMAYAHDIRRGLKEK